MWNNEDKLKEQLDQFEVDVPDFSIKKSKLTRIGNWIFAPTRIPFPEFGYKEVFTKLIVILPLILVALTMLPVVVFY